MKGTEGKEVLKWSGAHSAEHMYILQLRTAVPSSAEKQRVIITFPMVLRAFVGELEIIGPNCLI